ncbi:MAG: hypothetical protein HDR01_15950 [Lachnospiraceae bacterium]|nr:hypothetical protein [Lachnospiraceae bacterium]
MEQELRLGETEQINSPSQRKSGVRTHRVGTITLGIGLVGVGALFLAHMFLPEMSYEFIYKVWPVIFILLGIEILLANGRKNVEFVYDKTAIGLAAFLIIFSMLMAVIGFAVETSTRYYEQEYQRWIHNTYDEKAGNIE